MVEAERIVIAADRLAVASVGELRARRAPELAAPNN